MLGAIEVEESVARSFGVANEGFAEGAGGAGDGDSHADRLLSGRRTTDDGRRMKKRET